MQMILWFGGEPSLDTDNQKPLVWLVEVLNPIHQLGTKPGQCQTWTATGDGGQGPAVA